MVVATTVVEETAVEGGAAVVVAGALGAVVVSDPGVDPQAAATMVSSKMGTVFLTRERYHTVSWRSDRLFVANLHFLPRTRQDVLAA